MTRYLVSQTITHQVEIEAVNDEEARAIFREFDVHKLPVVDTSEIEVSPVAFSGTVISELTDLVETAEAAAPGATDGRIGTLA